MKKNKNTITIDHHTYEKLGFNETCRYIWRELTRYSTRTKVKLEMTFLFVDQCCFESTHVYVYGKAGRKLSQDIFSNIEDALGDIIQQVSVWTSDEEHIEDYDLSCRLNRNEKATEGDWNDAIAKHYPGYRFVEKEEADDILKRQIEENKKCQ